MAAMKRWMTPAWMRCAATLCIAAAAASFAVQAGMGEPAYEAALERIEAQQKAARKACGRLKANARDICLAEARGTAKVARAQLEATRAPSPEAEQSVKEARAAADHAVATERCEDARRKQAREGCRRKADAAREAAIRQAKVEKVEALDALKAAQLQKASGQAQPEPTLAEQYAAARARCVISGAERDPCLEEARRRFGQP